MWILDAVIQWLHIVAAALVIGGLFFALYIMTPALSGKEGEAGTLEASRVMRRFRGVVWVGVAALLLTGAYNLLRALAAGRFEDPVYQHTLEAKVLLALVLFSCGVGLTLPSWGFFSSRRRFFMAFNTHLGLLIVLLSTVLRRYVG